MPEEELLANERRELCRIHKIRLDGMDKKLQRLDIALYGNGEPEKGVLWMATTNKKTLDWVAKIVFGILIVVSSNIALRLLPEVAKVLSTGKL
jgi:hypothetical protein